MNKIKKGQKVWVSLKGVLKETTIKSVGYKYITLDGIEILFDSKTLKRAGNKNSPYFIIVDIEKYINDTEQHYKELIDKFNSLEWKSVDRVDLDKVADILSKY